MKNTLLTILFLALSFISLNSSAQSSERLIAVCYYDYNYQNVWIPTDSTIFRYSGSRNRDSTWGWQLGWENVYACDTLIRYQNLNNVYNPYQKRVRTWSSDNKLLVDSLYAWSTNVNDFTLNSYLLNSYNTSGQPAESRDFPQYGQMIDRIDFDYDAAGHTTVLAHINNLSDSLDAIWWHYNSNNQLTAYLNRSFNPGTSNYLSYTESLYHYDSNGRLDTIENLGLNQSATAVVPVSLVIDSYDVSGLMTSQASWTYGTNGYENRRTYYSYDVNGNMTQSILMLGDSLGNWSNTVRYQYTYDAMNMLTTSTQNSWDTTSSTWAPILYNMITHLYYEPYTLPNGIADIQSSGDLRLYPVPAVDMLQLSVKWNEAQASTATIYDATGRKYTEWPLPCTDAYHGYIPVAMLPGGTYVLQVKGENGSVTKSFDVRK